MNKHQLFPQVSNWLGKSLGSDNVIRCNDCHKETCQICGNCDCDGFPCSHQKEQLNESGRIRS